MLNCHSTYQVCSLCNTISGYENYVFAKTDKGWMWYKQGVGMLNCHSTYQVCSLCNTISGYENSVFAKTDKGWKWFLSNAEEELP